MPQYAADTSVPVSRSQEEIERTLQRYGAQSFMRGWDQQRAVLAFVLEGRQIRFFLPMPDKEDFRLTPGGRSRTAQSQTEAWEQACRQRWRALALVVKAKLEAVEAGISTFEEEFLANIVLPSGGTVGEWMKPQIVAAYKTGSMPALLPAVVGKVDAVEAGDEQR